LGIFANDFHCKKFGRIIFASHKQNLNPETRRISVRKWGKQWGETKRREKANLAKSALTDQSDLLEVFQSGVWFKSSFVVVKSFFISYSNSWFLVLLLRKRAKWRWAGGWRRLHANGCRWRWSGRGGGRGQRRRGIKIFRNSFSVIGKILMGRKQKQKQNTPID
jgi:hypothetical protein